MDGHKSWRALLSLAVEKNDRSFVPRWERATKRVAKMGPCNIYSHYTHQYPPGGLIWLTWICFLIGFPPHETAASADACSSHSWRFSHWPDAMILSIGSLRGGFTEHSQITYLGESLSLPFSIAITIVHPGSHTIWAIAWKQINCEKIPKKNREIIGASGTSRFFID